MNVLINGTPTETAIGTVVADVVARLGQSRAGVAVAVNAKVVPRAEWATTELYASDRVEVLTAVPGG